MGKRVRVFFFLLSVLGFVSAGLAADKVRLGTPVKGYPSFELLMMAAEEKGIWKQNGLDVEWVPFRAAADMQRAAAGGAIEMGYDMAFASIFAVGRGVPILVVADTGVKDNFYIWVRVDSPLKEPRQLKGAKIGITRSGGVAHAYGLVVAKALGLEKDIQFVAGGGVVEEFAAIKAGALDGRVGGTFDGIPLKMKGEVRDLVSVRDFLPKTWVELVVFSRKDYAERNPEVVKRVVRSVLGAGDFISKNPSWSNDQMKSQYGYSEEVAKAINDVLSFSRHGRIDRTGMENVRNFLVEYGLIAKDKAPSVDEVFSNRYAE